MRAMKYSIIIIFFLSLTMKAQEEQLMDETMKTWMEFMSPGKMHEVLSNSVGKWKTTIHSWTDPTEPEPMISEGEAVAEMILGGRYLQYKHSGNSMGMPMEGISIEAYDNAMGKFYSIWIDNMGTGIATSEGTFDEASQTIIYYGKMTDPVLKKMMDFKQTIKFTDKDNSKLDMFIIENGEEIRLMEILFTRIK